MSSELLTRMLFYQFVRRRRVVLTRILLFFVCSFVVTVVRGQEPEPQGCLCWEDSEVSCFTIFKHLPPNHPNYLQNVLEWPWMDPNPMPPFPGGNGPPAICHMADCTGPLENRKCSNGGVFQPLFPPGADWWYMAVLTCEGGWTGVEEEQSPTACAQILPCRCEEMEVDCTSGEIIQWVPVLTTADQSTAPCEQMGGG